MLPPFSHCSVRSSKVEHWEEEEQIGAGGCVCGNLINFLSAPVPATLGWAAAQEVAQVQMQCSDKCPCGLHP